MNVLSVSKYLNVLTQVLINCLKNTKWWIAFKIANEPRCGCNVVNILMKSGY